MTENKICVITGATSGIGKATAIQLANLNIELVLVGRNPTKLEYTKQFIAKKTGNKNIHFFLADLSSQKDIIKVSSDIKKQYAYIDILINNAGVISDSLLLRMKDEDFEHTMQTNMYGTFYCTHRVIQSMVKNRWGRIINISSVVGIRGNIGQSNYAASKSAIHGFSKSIAKEVATRGITVNVVAPGYVKTATSDVLSEKMKENVKSWIPMGRFGEIEEIVPIIVFLTTDEAKYITGEIIRVDGGMAI